MSISFPDDAVYKTNLISTIVEEYEDEKKDSVYKTNLISTIVDDVDDDDYLSVYKTILISTIVDLFIVYVSKEPIRLI